MSALQAGEQNSIRDRDMIRREIRESELRILRRVEEVDEGCREFRIEARETWSKRGEAKRSVTVAWIGGGCLLLASIVQTAALLTGG